MANGGKKGSAGDFENIFGSLVTKAGFTGVFEKFFLRGAKTLFPALGYYGRVGVGERFPACPSFFDIIIYELRFTIYVVVGSPELLRAAASPGGALPLEGRCRWQGSGPQIALMNADSI